MIDGVSSPPRLPAVGGDKEKEKCKRMIDFEAMVLNSDDNGNMSQEESHSESCIDSDESSCASSCSPSLAPNYIASDISNEEGFDITFNTNIKEDKGDQIPASFIPKFFDADFIHENHCCIVCDEFPIVGHRIHANEFKPGQGCCYNCFKELYKRGDKNKRAKWLACVEPQQLKSDISEQQNVRMKRMSSTEILPKVLSEIEEDVQDASMEISCEGESAEITHVGGESENDENGVNNYLIPANEGDIEKCISNLKKGESSFIDNESFVPVSNADSPEKDDKTGYPASSPTCTLKNDDTFYSSSSLPNSTRSSHPKFGEKEEAFEMLYHTTPRDSFNASFMTASTIEEDRCSPAKSAEESSVPDQIESDVSFSRSFLNMSGSSEDEEENHGVDLDDKSNCLILGTSFDDIRAQPHVLSLSLMEALLCFIPEHISHENYWLKFSLVRDGAKFDTMRNVTRATPYSIMAIQTTKGDVFGRYVPVIYVYNS